MAETDYDPPGIGSLMPLRSQYADDSGSEFMKEIGAFLMEKGLISEDMIPTVEPKFLRIRLSDYVGKVPVRKHKDHWVDSGDQIVILHPETYIPFFVNSSGSKICRLCDGEHSVGDIIKEIKAANSSLPEKVLIEDLIKMLLLLEETDFLEFKE
jgi:hypothetical protein